MFLHTTRTVAPHIAAELRAPILERLSNSLHQEGARNLVISSNRIIFKGITGYQSVAPLTNIERGEIEIDEQSGRLSYVIDIEKWPFQVFGLLLIAFSVASLLGFNRLIPFAFFCSIVLVFFCMHSLLIRRRFHRWIGNVLQDTNN